LRPPAASSVENRLRFSRYRHLGRNMVLTGDVLRLTLFLGRTSSCRLKYLLFLLLWTGPFSKSFRFSPPFLNRFPCRFEGDIRSTPISTFSLFPPHFSGTPLPLRLTQDRKLFETFRTFSSPFPGVVRSNRSLSCSSFGTVICKGPY